MGCATTKQSLASLEKWGTAIEDVELNAFGDASTKEIGAIVYSVVKQHSGTTQQLVAEKVVLQKEV